MNLVSCGSPLIIDGALGTLLASNLGLTLRQAHMRYLEAGARILTADTVACAARGSDCTPALKEALLARDMFVNAHPTTRVWVAGSIGALPPHVDDARQMRRIYGRVVGELLAGGADMLLVETMVSPRQAQAALQAATEQAPHLPVILSCTPARVCPQSFLAAIASLAVRYGACALGVNCGYAPAESFDALCRLAPLSPLPLVFYPAIPPVITPSAFASFMAMAIEKLHIAIAGGCCGTTPDHINALTAKLGEPDCMLAAHIFGRK